MVKASGRRDIRPGTRRKQRPNHGQAHQRQRIDPHGLLPGLISVHSEETRIPPKIRKVGISRRLRRKYET
jgi:hypothetical protein